MDDSTIKAQAAVTAETPGLEYVFSDLCPSRRVVEQMRALIPDLGRRRLTYQEFLELAARLGIKVFDEVSIEESRGACFSASSERRIYIFIHQALQEPERSSVAYHELTHAILHIWRHSAVSKHVRERISGRMEREANLVGALAVGPLVDQREAAGLLGVDTAALRRMVRSKEIKNYFYCGQTVYSRVEVDAVLERCATRSRTSGTGGI
ncbi:MAG: ImmA/IrrE family metallo-endopeptidase [Blastocatellales bacterium]|nr:ImmA/IrrE family metallo-endopeptidase [Blastocatellales bacterium]